VQLRTALEDILALEGAKKPVRVRFFRVQMQTIITRALQELDIKPVQSRRCFSLIGMFLLANSKYQLQLQTITT
jgi:hypothetical protein